MLDDDNTEIKKEYRLGKGEQGVVYKGKIGNLDFVIKKMYVDKKDAKHIEKNNIYTKGALKIESFIEIAACTLITELVKQKICPNFVITYGFDFIERDTVCKKEYPYKTLLYNEWIPNVQLFSQFCDDPSHTVSEWFNAYFQILAAIYTLGDTLGLSHSDLHSNNILVAKIPKGGHWKYTIDGVDYYVPNLGYQFLLNDFGHAWIPGKMESWYVRERLKPKRTQKLVDPIRIFDEVLEYSLAPKRVKEIIDSTIDLFKTDRIEVIDIIYTIFGSFFFLTESIERSPNRDKKKELENECKMEPYFCYFKKLKSKLIDSFNADIGLERGSIPKRLWNLI